MWFNLKKGKRKSARAFFKRVYFLMPVAAP